MPTFYWDITEGIPAALPGVGGSAGGQYSVNVEEFDIALGDLPFNLDLNEDHRYERTTAQLRKDQFDAQPTVGEQSLSGWWLRSQFAFWGGAGIKFLEPLQNEDVGTRFIESSGVEVFTDDGSVNLLKRTELGPSATGTCEAVAGPNRLLMRDGTGLAVWDGATKTAVTGTSSAYSIAYTGSTFLVGDNGNIYTLAEASGTALAAKYNTAGGNVRVFWAKDRIFAGVGPKLFELTLAGSGAFPGSPLYTHPDASWEWTGVAETEGAVWAAGRSGARSAIHVISIADTGDTPTLTGGTVAIQLPETETVNTIRGYLGFLLVGTSEGLRVALTDQQRASLGPLLWDDAPVLGLGARSDYAYTGHANGLTRKVDLSNEIAGDLGFAWANHLTGGAGSVRSILWFQDREYFSVDAEGVYREHAAELVEQGSLRTGHIRFGTIEGKQVESARIGLRTPSGSTIAILHEHDGHDPTLLITLGNLDGAEDVLTHHSTPVEQFNLTFLLNRDGSDATIGPVLKNYQLRALPAPSRRQRLMRLPCMLLDLEMNRQGVTIGGDGFAAARLFALEAKEAEASPVTMRDLRTGENRRVMIEQVTVEGQDSPDHYDHNFGGLLSITVRTLGD